MTMRIVECEEQSKNPSQDQGQVIRTLITECGTSSSTIVQRVCYMLLELLSHPI